MAQLFGGCEKGWHYLSPPAGSGGKKREIAGTGVGGAAVLSTLYVLMWLVNKALFRSYDNGFL